MTIKGRGPGKMPWRAASGLRAVDCRPLFYGTSIHFKNINSQYFAIFLDNHF